MSRTKWWIGVIFCALGACLPAASADDAYDTVSNDQISELTSRIASLEQQLNQSVSGGYEAGGYGAIGPGCGCGGAGCAACCCDPCCRSQGWVGGVEVAYLKPHHSEGTGFPGIFAAPLDGEPGTINGNLDPDFEAAPRIWVGFRRCDGLGVRARYWEFDHTFQGGVADALIVDTTISGVFHGWDTWVADLEVTDTTDLGCYWIVTLSAGYRHVEYFETAGLTDPAGVVALGTSKSFIGDGVTAAAEFRRQVSCNLGLYLSVRSSALYGDEFNATEVNLEEESANGTQPTVALHLNDVKFIYEAQLAVEYSRPLQGCASFFARAGVEAQYWDTFGVENNILPLLGAFDDNAVGFAGFFAAVGIER